MVVITSSSIPPRFQYLPKFYQKLANQKTRPDKVELWVARNYRRFPGDVPALPELPDWVEVNWIDDDLGPATKVLPASRKWRGKDVDLLYCDDDRIYDPNWVGRFLEAKTKFPGMALCESGFTLSYLDMERTKELPGPPPEKWTYWQRKAYRLKRLGALGLKEFPREHYSTPGYVDVVEGFAGVMVRPDWFTDEDWDIPDILWTVDDVWLSGQMLRRGIHAHTTDLPLRCVPLEGATLVEQLTVHVQDGVDRMDANRACVQYFRDHYGIWL